MANTYSQIYLHFVFAVRRRECLINRDHKEELHKYITGLVQKRSSKMLAVHCMPDHTHLFIGYKSSISIPDLRAMNLLIRRNGYMEDLPGKRASAYFRIPNHRSALWLTISKIKSLTTRKGLSKMNTRTYWVGLKFLLRRNICSNFLMCHP
jgi:REP element-mobilizing transposase RayT